MENGQFRKLRISAVREEVSGFKIFSFEDGHNISYKPGQYLTFTRTINGEEIRRSYSIISVPQLQEPLSVGIKRIPNGFFSRYFHDELKLGDEVSCAGAGGLFVLPENLSAYKQLYFFAAGSGITPIYALIRSALLSDPEINIVLVYSNASPEKTIFFDELKELADQNPAQFHVEFLFSNSPQLHRARLYNDLLLELVNKHAVAGLDHVLFYICGPEAYMRMCTYVLQQEGIDPSRIRREHFLVYNIKPVKPLPPDKNTHQVQLSIAGEEFEFMVEYPDNILKAARKHGISLPYSCETGRCGNCVARCTSGTIWHSYNEVLTEQELRKGLVLTCVGHPVDGDVKLVMR